jgi:hypothetical protein
MEPNVTRIKPDINLKSQSILKLSHDWSGNKWRKKGQSPLPNLRPNYCNPMTDDTKMVLCCCAEDMPGLFSVHISPGDSVDDLKVEIFKRLSGSFAGRCSLDLILKKVCYIMIPM